MRDYLQRIITYLDFPEESHAPLLAAYDQIAAHPQANAVLMKWVETYQRDIHMDQVAALREVEEAAQSAGVHKYTAGMLLYLCLTRHLRELYEEWGIDEQIYRDSCSDLLWKLRECWKMYGVWGTFVAWWEPGFYDMTRFALGRLQFELVPFPAEWESGGRKRPGGMTRAINVHIPSRGKLRAEDCEASYRMAVEFFGHAFPGDEVAFTCESWMLFPPNREILKPDSGVVRFMADYEIFKTGESDDDLWRIFNVDYAGDPTALAEDTSMQRGYKKWLLAGNHAGWGEGIFFRPKTKRLESEGKNMKKQLQGIALILLSIMLILGFDSTGMDQFFDIDLSWAHLAMVIGFIGIVMVFAKEPKNK